MRYCDCFDGKMEESDAGWIRPKTTGPDLCKGPSWVHQIGSPDPLSLVRIFVLNFKDYVSYFKRSLEME